MKRAHENPRLKYSDWSSISFLSESSHLRYRRGGNGNVVYYVQFAPLSQCDSKAYFSILEMQPCKKNGYGKIWCGIFISVSLRLSERGEVRESLSCYR